MGEEGVCIGWGDGRQGRPDRRDDGLAGTNPGTTQRRLRLGEGGLNRIEVRRVGWQEDEMAACGLNQGACASALVHGEIVEHDDLAWPQAGHEDPLYERLEDEPFDRATHQKTLTDAR